VSATRFTAIAEEAQKMQLGQRAMLKRWRGEVKKMFGKIM
jgi:hypothetical protein